MVIQEIKTLNREDRKAEIRGLLASAGAGAADKLMILHELLTEHCHDEDWGDQGSYAKVKEFVTAVTLGHIIPSNKNAGADAFTPEGQPCEYKSTTQKTCRGTYTGCSSKEYVWEKFEEYLKVEKIGPYQHFYSRFDKQTGKLVECWTMDGDVVLELLLPKFKKKWPKYQEGTLSDNRPAANISWTEIQKYGTKVR
jgi:hypothetical protein